MNVGIAVIGIGGWYPRGVARLIQRFHEVSPGFTIKAWVNALPPGAPSHVIEDGYDYTPYCAKPFAMAALRDSGFEIGLLLDAAFFPVQHISPLVEYIGDVGYFLCDNGAKVGEWCSDRALGLMKLRDYEAMEMTEASSYCVGLDFTRNESHVALNQWCAAANFGVFPGPHTNIGHTGRNVGRCSIDPRVKGHRHDQTALSIITHRLGMRKLVARPRFTAYLGSEDSTTVLVNHGGF